MVSSSSSPGPSSSSDFFVHLFFSSLLDMAVCKCKCKMIASNAACRTYVYDYQNKYDVFVEVFAFNVQAK